MWTRINKIEKGISEKYRLYIELERFFGFYKSIIIVEGSSTVWNYYPTGLCVGTIGEYRICELITAYEMEQGLKLSKILKQNDFN